MSESFEVRKTPAKAIESDIVAEYIFNGRVRQFRLEKNDGKEKMVNYYVDGIRQQRPYFTRREWDILKGPLMTQ